MNSSAALTLHVVVLSSWSRLRSLFVLTLLVACSDGADALAPAPGEHVTQEPDEPTPVERAGSLSLGLTLPEGTELTAFGYVITGPGYDKASSIDVSHSRTVSALIEGIPAGTGYAVTLSGNGAPPSDIVCSGSATFAVMAGAVTDVPVAVACHVRDEQVPPETVAAAVPLPASIPVALGALLLVLGSALERRRGQRSSGSILSSRSSK